MSCWQPLLLSLIVLLRVLWALWFQRLQLLRWRFCARGRLLLRDRLLLLRSTARLRGLLWGLLRLQVLLPLQ